MINLSPRRLHGALLGAALLAGCCTGPAMVAPPAEGVPAPPADLPDAVRFRTPTETFNERYYLALRDDRIWFKPNHERTGERGAWRVLGHSGRPEGCGLTRAAPPRRLVAIAADGVHLTALAADGVFYRAVNLRRDGDAPLTWTDAWGWFAATGPGLRWELGDLAVDGARFDVSDSHMFDVKEVGDGNGATHSVGLGVAHLYALDPSGTRIFYNDWWLPADWSRQTCGPQRGTFEALTLSASASTLFVVGRGGELYTRLTDFDAGGENPLLSYSFVAPDTRDDTRRLPLPPWRRQPPVPGGLTTARITIFQDGVGDAARTLRVEGRQGDRDGYFEKRIFDAAWVFHETGEPLSGPLLDGPAAPESDEWANPEDRRLVGTLTRDGVDEALTVELLDFHPVCSPARLRVRRGGVPVTQGGRELILAFHHVHTLVRRVRPIEP
ncbi:MAG: hypothetical protein CVT68_11100, partial [Actinobacteria bacterium HGW-Actinobacteria-8]